MIDVNDIAALLHAHEKLQGHPHLKNLRAAVAAKLEELEAAHAPKPAAEPDGTARRMVASQGED